MVAKKSRKSQVISSKLAGEKPEKTTKRFTRVLELQMPHHERVGEGDIKPENLKKVLLTTYDKQPKDFEQLLSLQGVGPKTIRALALISELVYNAPASREDPVKY
jgi:hypothetical protein